jgi:hypothetical protein
MSLPGREFAPTRRLLVRVLKTGLSPDTRTREWAARLIKQATGLDAKNLRITGRAVEFDVFTRDTVAAVESLSRIEQVIGPIGTLEDLTTKQEFLSDKEAVREAVKLYNEERFWEAHEVLEGVWRRKGPGGEKDALQGLILLCAAYVHLQKGEADVGIGILARALKKLTGSRIDTYFGINLRTLIEQMTEMIEMRRIRMVSIRPY